MSTASEGLDRVPESYRRLIGRLTKFKVKVWGTSSEMPADGSDRDVALSLDAAHVVSSKRLADDKHVLVLDIDHPSWLVKSTTEGHYHLYVDVKDGIEWTKYGTLLLALADAGVIEQGYADASIARGHSDVRLPWIRKGQENG